jgi:hypothetical protein
LYGFALRGKYVHVSQVHGTWPRRRKFRDAMPFGRGGLSDEYLLHETALTALHLAKYFRSNDVFSSIFPAAARFGSAEQMAFVRSHPDIDVSTRNAAMMCVFVDFHLL